MVHRVVFRVGSDEALDFWAERLAKEGVSVSRGDGSLTFTDPEGLGLELAVVETDDEPPTAEDPEIAASAASRASTACARSHATPRRVVKFLEEALGFTKSGKAGFEARGEQRGGHYEYETTEQAGIPGAGTVHHVAWASTPEEHEAWRERVAEGGGRPTPVIDRFYFKSIYFREPSGVLFEIATIGPGFTTDEPLETLGEHLSLPPDFERLREQVEPVLTPITNPRDSWAPH